MQAKASIVGTNSDLKIETKDEALDIIGFNNLFTAYPFQQNGSFTSNNNDIDEILDVAWHTVRLCALDLHPNNGVHIIPPYSFSRSFYPCSILKLLAGR